MPLVVCIGVETAAHGSAVFLERDSDHVTAALVHVQAAAIPDQLLRDIIPARQAAQGMVVAEKGIGDGGLGRVTQCHAAAADGVSHFVIRSGGVTDKGAVGDIYWAVLDAQPAAAGITGPVAHKANVIDILPVTVDGAIDIQPASAAGIAHDGAVAQEGNAVQIHAAVDRGHRAAVDGMVELESRIAHVQQGIIQVHAGAIAGGIPT